MSNELVTLQNELAIAKQEKEIMQLKLELAKVQAEKTSRLEDSLFSPALFQHYQKVAETLADSSVIPQSYIGKPQNVFVAIAMGYQLGFPVEQSLQDIAVINGRPCLWGDGLLSLALNHPECVSIDEEPILSKTETIGYRCTVVRKGHKPHVQEFTLQDANKAGLLGKAGPWKTYPTRMLQMRARSLAIRDKFADALRGLRIAEIEKDDSVIIDAEPIQTRTEQLRAHLEENVSRETLQQTEPETEATEVSDHDEPITEDQLSNINFLFAEKDFDEARRNKALNHFGVIDLDSLTAKQADLFISKLEKC